jgi:hypothetical protein
VNFLDWDPAALGARCSLDDLLEHRSNSAGTDPGE